jgi:outer membrane protein TolC
MEVHDALAAVAAAREQVAIAQSGLLAAMKELDLAKERFAVITAASYFEITNGLTAIAKARTNLVNALFQLNSARVNLARSTGSLKSLH